MLVTSPLSRRPSDLTSPLPQQSVLKMVALGVEKGDEIEATLDPPIQKALEVVLKGGSFTK